MNKIIVIYVSFFLPLALSAQTVNVNILKAKACIDQSKLDSALTLLNLENSSVQKEKLVGDIYFRKKAFGTSCKHYILADSIEKGTASYDLSRSYAAMNNAAKATAWLQKYMSLPGKKSELEITKDTAFQKISETNEWNQLWQKDWYSTSEIERNAVLALLSRGRVSEAAAELESNEGKFSPRHEYFYLQAKVYEKQHLNDLAIESMSKALTYNSFSDEYYALNANLLKNSKKYNDALESMNKAIRLNPYNPDYYLKRGEIAVLTGEFGIAEKDMKLYKSLYPNELETYHQLGLLENARGNRQNAMDYYDVLLAKDKSHVQYFLERGKLALQLDQVQKADEDFSMALDLNPGVPDAYLNKGKTLQILNDTKGACFYWAKARGLGSAEAANLIKDNCKE